jgi:hypothetical protein
LQNNLHLHIISFNIPFPPNYGGIIDVFYKLRSLKQLGVKIHLHCFEYGRKRAKELNQYCETVNYYKRLLGITQAIGKKPYIVKTRKSDELLNNLLKDNHPIMFEGLHTTFHLNSTHLKDRFTIVRTHNIESDYYIKLHAVEKNLFKQIYYEEEADRLKRYEPVLKNASLIAAISDNDYKYFNSRYSNTTFIPAFHPNDEISIKKGTGNFILYHGNLSVAENISAAKELINSVFSKIDYSVKIAGRNPEKSLIKLSNKFKNIELIANPSDKEMNSLITDAQINILTTSQNTGIKLKLIASMFSGRHCIVNDMMVNNTGLENLCHIANSPKQIIEKINELWEKEIDNSISNERNKILFQQYSNIKNAAKLVSFLS